MPLNYDPDATPQTDPRVIQQGMDLGLFPYHVICVEPGSESSDTGGVTFMAWGNFVPRVGERITLQDGKTCEVRRVYYKTVVYPPSNLISLLPNVVAVRISPDDEGE